MKDVSFTLKKGDRIALVGTTGSGKSTIIRLLIKAYSGYRGSITINGEELRDVPLRRVRQTVSVMQQDIYLFNDTIGFNIGLGREGIGPREVEEAARFVYADRFVQPLPGKYDFVIQDNGDNLSKGQGQLISFARAISGNKELIILEKEIRQWSDEVIIMTDDGSYGSKGLVTQGAEEIIKREKVDECVTIGPAVMMKFVALLTQKYEIPTQASLNAIMVDGTGMCGACRASVGGQTKFTCIDGPEFNAHQIDFDELILRLGGYKAEEKQAWERANS